MAESKAKIKASGKPESAAVEAKPKAKAKTAKPAAAAKRNVKASHPTVSAEQRYRMIAEAAYYIAERRKFAPGDAAADWAQAEMQIVTLLGKK